MVRLTSPAPMRGASHQTPRTTRSARAAARRSTQHPQFGQAASVQLSGYDTGFRDDDQPIGHLLGEVTIAVHEADELRKIAAFITQAADLLEVLGPKFSHEHLRDWYDDWTEGDPDLIVYRID